MALFYGKFDENAYYTAHPDVKEQKMDAEQHWARYGISQGCEGYIIGVPLGGQFDASGYLNCNPDVRNAGTDAKEHYKECGWNEGRDISIWVDASFESSGTWLHLAKQGENFSIDGTKTVRYGTSTQWIVRQVSGPGACTGEFFGHDPAFGVVKSCQVMVSGPEPGGTWSCIGAEGETVTLSGTRTVRYGAGTQWIMKLLSGCVECTDEFFGWDPAPGSRKVCEVLGPNEAKGKWQKVASEGQRFSIIGAQTIRYGEGQHWITRVMAGLEQCTNEAFGGDPSVGAVKSCEVWVPPLASSPIAVLDFDGVDDYVEAGEADLPPDIFTIEAWIKPDKMHGGIVEWGSQGPESREVVLGLSYQAIAQHWRDSDLAVKGQDLVGKWHHVASTVDGKFCCIYLDGKLVGRKKLSLHGKGKKDVPSAKESYRPNAANPGLGRRKSQRIPDRSNFRMGRRRSLRNRDLSGSANPRIGVTNSSDYFNGNLAEIRIWDRVRSAEEIRDDMAHRLVGDEQGLVAYWRLHNRGEADEKIIGATWQFDDNLEQVIDPSYYYRLTTMWQGDGRSLHILNDGRNNLPVLAGTGDYASQYWQITPIGKDYYRLTNRWLGLQNSLDIIDDGVNNKPIMANSGNYAGQFLRLTLFQNGYYRITTQWQGEGKSLDIINDGQNNRLILAATANVAGQFWKLTRTDILVGEKDGIGSGSLVENNGEMCNSQSEGCLSQGCASQGGPGCAGQACMSQSQGCSAQGCPAQVQGCAAHGCIGQAAGCAAQGCAAQVQGCAAQGCAAQASGCVAQACGAQAVGGASQIDACGVQACGGQAGACVAEGCLAQAEGCAAQGCLAQAEGCAAQGCLAQADGCAAQGCVAQADGCAAQGCLAQAEGCAAEGCLAKADGCTAQGCGAEAAGCIAQGCAAQAEACIGQACAAQAEGCGAQACAAQVEGCAAEGCGAKVEGCAAQGCAAEASGCAAQGCGAQVEGCAAQGCAGHLDVCAAQGCGAQVDGCAAQGCAGQAEACAAEGCGAEADGCAAQGCAGQAEVCAAEGCLAQAEGCAAQGCTADSGCAAKGCLAQAGGCAAQGCAGDWGCAAQGCGVDACAAHGCAGNACAIDIGGPCAADGQLGPCLVNIPGCPFIL